MDVIATADEALAGKYSAACLGYFNDPYLPYFVKRFTKRSPLINRGYYARTAAIRGIVAKFFGVFPEGQLINIGAGLDTLPFWLGDNFPKVSYIEIDMPEVIARKSSIIKSSVELLKKVRQRCCDTTGDTSTSAEQRRDVCMDDSSDKCCLYEPLLDDNYKMIPVDMYDFDVLKRLFSKAGISHTTPTLLLAECVFVYMKPSEADKVLKWVTDIIDAPSCLISYEQMNPYDSFGRTMVHNLSLRGCPLLSIERYPTIQAQYDRLRLFGWIDVEIRSMLDVYDKTLSPSDIKRIERLEIFDEIEEWRLISNHYFLCVATKGFNQVLPEQASAAKWMFEL